MTFFYNLNKKLDGIATRPEVAQLNERDEGKPGKNFEKIAKSAAERYGSKEAGERVAGAVRNKLKAQGKLEEEGMSRAAKGYEKYGREGMQALAKAGREGKDLDKVRAKYDKYDNKEVDENLGDVVKKVGGMAKKASNVVLDKLGHGSDADMIRDLQKRMGLPPTGKKPMEPKEGNAFTGALKSTPKGGKFKLGDKEFTDTSSLEEVMAEDLQADDGKHYRSFDDFISRFDADSFDDTEVHSAGMQIRGYINGRNVMSWEFDDESKTSGYGNYDMTMLEGTPMTPKQKSFAKLAPPADKITFADKIAGAKKEVDEMLGDVAAEAIKSAVGKKTESRSKGTAFDKEYMDKVREKEKAETHSRYNVQDTGYSKRYTRKTQDEPTDDAEVSDEPKQKGRPKGPAKGPERVTAKSYKYKAGRPGKAMEGNMNPADSGEYDREGDMAKEQMHTIMSAAKELHRILRDDENLPEWVQKKITLAKEYIDTARDYMLTQHAERAEEQPIAEKAVSVAQRRAAGIAHAAQKGEIPKKELRGASKEMARMPKSELKKFAKTKETGLPAKVKKADEGKGDGNLANNAKPYDKVTQGDVVAGRLGKDEMGGKKKKEKDVDESSTTAGSVATAPAKTSKGGYNFGGGVYESLDRKFKQALSEGMNITVNMSAGEEGEPRKSITVTADGAEADQLAQLLQMAGMNQQEQQPCDTCGATPCGCESLDENSPDWPTNTETSDNALQYSGGLNGPKSTGQTTVPVIASQLRRQVSMEESAKLENNLFRLYQNYKTQ
jgi:hypothetical protein